MTIQFSDKLLADSNTIDSQHRDIFSAAQKVLTHNRVSLNLILLFRDMDNFKNKMLENFATEEELMTTLSTVIPLKVMEKHKAAHHKIIDRMDKALTKNSTFDQVQEVVNFIVNDWMPKHTKEHDRVLTEQIDAYYCGILHPKRKRFTPCKFSV